MWRTVSTPAEVFRRSIGAANAYRSPDVTFEGISAHVVSVEFDAEARTV